MIAIMENPRQEWTKEDHWAEQTFDADCNYCKFAERSIQFGPEEKRTRRLFGLPARCTKFNREVRTFAQPGLFAGHPCFVHIQTGEPAIHGEPNSLESKRFYD